MVIPETAEAWPELAATLKAQLIKVEAKLTLHKAEAVRLHTRTDKLQAIIKAQRLDIKYLNEVIYELQEENPE